MSWRSSAAFYRRCCPSCRRQVSTAGAVPSVPSGKLRAAMLMWTCTGRARTHHVSSALVCDWGGGKCLRRVWLFIQLCCSHEKFATSVRNESAPLWLCWCRNCCFEQQRKSYLLSSGLQLISAVAALIAGPEHYEEVVSDTSRAVNSSSGVYCCTARNARL